VCRIGTYRRDPNIDAFFFHALPLPSSRLPPPGLPVALDGAGVSSEKAEGNRGGGMCVVDGCMFGEDGIPLGAR
jgi:hypothetical protein